MRTSISSGGNENSSEISDEMLIHAIARGSAWAMEPLVERYNRYLYSIVYHMVSNHAIAEDLMQEVFVLVWNRASSYTSALGSVRGWMTTITRNRTIDYLRSTQRHAAFSEATWEDVERDEHTAQPDAEEGALRAIQGEQVREALMHIPPEQRMVISLAYFQAWTHSEIAEQCQIPLGTVKARMRLGIKRLKSLLEEKGITQSDS